MIKKTCDAHTALKANPKAGNLGRRDSKRYRSAVEKPVVFRPEGAQPYDDRMLSWQIAERRVSVWTVYGRMKDVAFSVAPEQPAMLALYGRGEADLVCRDGKWFLPATCEVPKAGLKTDPVDFLGLDLGIVNIATTSDGEKKNTPSAKRRPKKRRRKEAHDGPRTSTTRWRSMWWPRQNAPVAGAPWRT